MIPAKICGPPPSTSAPLRAAVEDPPRHRSRAGPPRPEARPIRVLDDRTYHGGRTSAAAAIYPRAPGAPVVRSLHGPWLGDHGLAGSESHDSCTSLYHAGWRDRAVRKQLEQHERADARALCGQGLVHQRKPLLQIQRRGGGACGLHRRLVWQRDSPGRHGCWLQSGPGSRRWR